ncbi:MAG: FAD binding domain-containing protein [Sporichthyaceae bacterium]
MDFHSPADLAEALALRAAIPNAQPIAGGTDVMVELNLGDHRPAALLDLGRLPELRGHGALSGATRIGAGEPFTSIVERLHDPLPALAAASRTVGSPQIRNRGTLGGNLATASPAGDAHPVLLALDATIEVASARGTRRIPAREFFVGPGRSVLAPDELVVAVEVPHRGSLQTFAKVGTRNAMVIAVCSFALSVDPATHHVGTGIGSAGPTPLRAPDAEALLTEALDADGWDLAAVSPAVLEEFAALVSAAARPIDDHRGSAAYRRHALRVLARRSLTWCGARVAA